MSVQSSSLLPPSAAEYSFERHTVFMILLREIMKTVCLSKYDLARSAIKRPFTQPQYNLARRANK